MNERAQDLLQRFMRQIDRPRAAPKLRRDRIRPDYRRQPFVSVAEAAELYGVGHDRIYQLISRGLVKRGGGGAYYIDQTSLNRAFARLRRGRTA